MSNEKQRGRAFPFLSERNRRHLLGLALIVVSALAVLYYVSRYWLYFGAILERQPAPPVPTGVLGDVHVALSLALGALAAAGLLAVFVLGISFANFGKDSLHRRTYAWWILAGAFALVLRLANVAPYAPYVDLYSRTEAVLVLAARQLQPLGLFFWLVLALFIERGLAFEGGARTSRYGLARATAVTLAVVWLCTFAIIKLAHMPEVSVDPLGALQKAVCGSTHAVVGTARDFEVVREAKCVAYEDRGPADPPDMLGRCESLQFKVDVIDQLWPLAPAHSGMERERTFRWGGVRDRVSAMRELMETGHVYKREGAERGARVFVGAADPVYGATMLRNAARGILYSEAAPTAFPRYALDPGRSCSVGRQRASDVHEYCDWDYAITVKARALRAVPNDGRSKNQFPGSIVDREPSGDPAAARLVLKAGDMLEVDFDVIDNLDPAKALPSHPLRMRYRNVDAIDPRRLYAEWFDAVGARRFVYFVQEDALERGLLQFTRRGLHGANSALPPQCLAARAALGK